MAVSSVDDTYFYHIFPFYATIEGALVVVYTRGMHVFKGKAARSNT
jgi:hypothetical protein